MKARRKHSTCLNCGEILQKQYNFCPNCGQENTDNEVSIGMLLREFTSNFFSFDSRFGRTFKPFLFSPGKITEAFNSGKRVHYANPIRWYLVISIFHFFFMAKVFQPTDEERRNVGFINTDNEISAEKYDSLYHHPDTAEEDSWPLTGSQFVMIDYLSQESDLSTEEILDSLKLSNKPLIDRLAIKQLTKLNQESTASLNSYLLRQIPVIIFFLLPLYAFLLKLFFWKRGLYIKHLIHSIHLHSFFFFLMGVSWIITLIRTDFQSYSVGFTLILTVLYAILSFRRIYQTHVFKALLKFAGIGFIYVFSLTFVLLVGIVLSLLLF